MIIELRDETGRLISDPFKNMDTAAFFCMEYPDYGITLIPEEGEKEWDRREWQSWLDYYAETC